MTESVLARRDEARQLFTELHPEPLARGRAAGRPRGAGAANTDWGLALADDEIDYLVNAFTGWAQPHRRRADDVRAGQQRALPPQDLQRRLRIDGVAQDRACSA
jgi:phosphoribosylformylglycinamidine synthase